MKWREISRKGVKMKEPDLSIFSLTGLILFLSLHTHTQNFEASSRHPSLAGFPNLPSLTGFQSFLSLTHLPHAPSQSLILPSLACHLPHAIPSLTRLLPHFLSVNIYLFRWSYMQPWPFYFVYSRPSYFTDTLTYIHLMVIPVWLILNGIES